MSRKKYKCYVIRDEKSKMLYGAFPFTDEGMESAKKYLKKITKGKKENLIIEEA